MKIHFKQSNRILKAGKYVFFLFILCCIWQVCYYHQMKPKLLCSFYLDDINLTSREFYQLTDKPPEWYFYLPKDIVVEICDSVNIKPNNIICLIGKSKIKFIPNNYLSKKGIFHFEQGDVDKVYIYKYSSIYKTTFEFDAP